MTTSRRKRRTDREMFLSKLTELAAGEPKLIGNGALSAALGWDQKKYDRIWDQLVLEKAIIVGRGRGGSVALSQESGTKALTLFISYSHADETFKNDLVKHLEPLRRLKLIETWHDRKIKAGEEWQGAISAQLEKAEIILLLISIDFINSDYCYGTELEKALELQSGGNAIVVPIILRSCLWQHTSFANLQALPRDAKAISTWTDRDLAMVSVAEGIQRIAEEKLGKR